MSTTSRYLLVRTGGRRCALPLDVVRRVVRGLQIYPVPGSDQRLLGLAQFGGEPMAIVDLAALFDEVGGRHGDGVTVVVGRRSGGDSGSVLGLAVDEVAEVSEIEGSSDPAADDRVMVLDSERLLGELDPVSANGGGTPPEERRE